MKLQILCTLTAKDRLPSLVRAVALFVPLPLIVCHSVAQRRNLLLLLLLLLLLSLSLLLSLLLSLPLHLHLHLHLHFGCHPSPKAEDLLLSLPLLLP
jgi:hypothetical protein